MNFIKSCEFNIDTACVEVKLADGSMVSIDCIAVENEYANNMYETSELDYLIYNEPMSYVRLSIITLVLNSALYFCCVVPFFAIKICTSKSV